MHKLPRYADETRRGSDLSTYEEGEPEETWALLLISNDEMEEHLSNADINKQALQRL